MRRTIPKHGEQRKLTKFAWFPVKLDDHRIWWEYYLLRQHYNRSYDCGWVTDRKEMIDPQPPGLLQRLFRSKPVLVSYESKRTTTNDGDATTKRPERSFGGRN
jgi:hypothetical protein